MQKVVIVLLMMGFHLFGLTQTVLLPVDPVVCEGAGIQFSATVACPGSLAFTWMVNGDTVATNTSGLYSIIPTQPNSIVSVIAACTSNGTTTFDTLQTTLTMVPAAIDAGPDQYIDSGTMVTLQATGIFDSVLWTPSYLVDFPMLPTVHSMPAQNTTYMVQAFVGTCVFFDYVTVYLTNVFKIPNTFSPNNDGTNDTWIIPGIENYPNNRMLILNRFGDVLYESPVYNMVNAWAGTRNGHTLPDGVYYYLLDLGNGTIKKGTISIIR